MCSVIFDNNNGSGVTVRLNGAPGTTKHIPDDPVLYGYAFMGWYLDDGPADFENGIITFNAAVNGNRYYAKWAPIQTTITFDLNDGWIGETEDYGPIEYQGFVYSDPVDVPEPIRYGYTFTGWDPDLNGATQVWFTGVDQTYTAQWDIIVTTITFNLNGGAVLQNAGPIEYTGTMEYNPVDVPEPIRFGYRLTGWDPSLNGATQLWFTDADQTYTAQWEEIEPQ